MTGAFVYRFATPHDPKADILYVNVVPRYSCTNSCRFCSRKDAIKGMPNIYEKKAGRRLRLPKAPMAEGVVRELETRINPATDEIAFVGLGEPFLQFELVKNIIGAVRANGFRGNIRIDTNGLAKCWYGGNPAQELKTAGLDEIRISVNAVNGRDYAAISRSGYTQAFGKLCEFVTDCIRAGIKTCASFIVGFDDGEVKTRAKEEYLDFALSLGIEPGNVILRNYLPPLNR